MKKEDWYLKKQKGQSEITKEWDWSKSKSQPPSPSWGSHKILDVDEIMIVSRDKHS